jgi:putative hydroxymethylpyrimidine transport system substrate-binding protein
MDFSIKHIMKKYHYNENNIQFVCLKNGFISAFIHHRVDAVSSVWNIYEGELIRQHCPKAYFYPYIDMGLPGFADVVIVKSKNNSHSDESFKYALKKAIDFVRKDPDKAYEIAVKSHPELNTAFNKSTWRNFIPLFSDEK